MTSLKNVYAGVNPNSEKRKENDYYPTPPVATYALCKHFDVPHNVWEPAAGRGWISEELQRLGHAVYSSDLAEYPEPLVPIHTGKDFLDPSYFITTQAIVTNPPYKNDLAQKFVERAFEHAVPFVAVLCRLTFLEGMRRHKLFTQNPPQVAVFSGRINCDENLFMQGKQLGGMVSYAWFVWEKQVPVRDHNLTWIDTKSMYQDWKKEMGQ